MYVVREEEPAQYVRSDSSEAGGNGAYEKIIGTHARSFMVNDQNLNSQEGFSDNQVSTTKYSWFTFVPLNLFQQFSKLANLYFLMLAFLQVSGWIFPQKSHIFVWSV